MTSFAVEPIYGSVLLALIAATVTYVVILLVTPPTDNPRQRRWLIALRSTAALALLLALLRPTLLRTDNRPADAALIIAVDTSKSMTLPAGTGDDRWAVQTEVWRKLANSIFEIDETLDVRLVAYDQTTRQIEAQPDTLDALKPTGDLTDLAAGGLAAIQAAEGQPIAGIVMMGDGTQTAPQKGAGIGRVAETLDSLGVPFWTVPIGPAGGESASRDVAIDALQESYQLFAGNDVDVQFQVFARGLVGVDVPVRLTWIASDGTTTEVAERRVAATKSNQMTPLTIRLTAPPPGTYRLRVEAERQDGELVTTNNVQTAFVDVREGGGRILYLEGSLRNEQMLLRRSLRRFQDLDLTFRPILKDTSRRWPVDLNDLLEPGKFDIYIIGDLDANALGKEQLGELADAVSDGAGLVTLGGFQTYGAGGYADSGLTDVIPLRMDPARRKSIDAETANRTDQRTDAISIQLVRRHPITDLGGDDPAQAWKQLPNLVGANRLIGPKVAPGVEVLLETSDQQPLLVIGQYGRGRTAALAFDSTWRWWRGGNRDAHRRFWRQLMLWLLSREESGDDIVIEMDSRRFTGNNPPQFTASIQSIGDALVDANLVAELIDESGNASPLDVTKQQAGSAIRGVLPKTNPGFYRLRVRPENDSTSLQTEEMAFQSVDESRELASPMADPVFLRQLAAMTADHGGAAFAPDEIDALIETIKNRRRAAETPIVKKFRLGDGPLSGWILFTLFAGMLSAEWFLRRRWGLA
jgi:uncharacterized membrane protein